jgi:hypothetical protein
MRSFRFARGMIRDGFDRGAVGGKVGRNPRLFGLKRAQRQHRAR